MWRFPCQRFGWDSGFGWDAGITFILFAVVVVLMALFFFLFMRMKKSDEAYEILKEREEGLKRARSKAGSDYSSGLISEDEASRLIADIDKELEGIRNQTDDLGMRRLKK